MSKNLLERMFEFNERVSAYQDRYDPMLIEEFKDYWTEHNEGGRLMRFELKKNQPFNIGRRLGTFKKNSRKKAQPEMSKTVKRKLDKYD